jgi:hypothetical protein
VPKYLDGLTNSVTTLLRKEYDAELLSDEKLPIFSINLIRMKTLNKTILLAALLFYTTSLLAQERVNKGDVIIHISTSSPSFSSRDNHIDVYKRDTKAEIVYRKYNRINYSEVDKDTSYINLNIDIRQIDPEKLKKLGPIFDRHTIYDITKVIVDLKADTAYYNILKLVAQSSKHELETSKVGERVYLDGFSFSCEIITDAGTKYIGIHTPTAETHPIVSSLLNESYDRLFKKNKPK